MERWFNGGRSWKEAHQEQKLHSGVDSSSWEWREDKPSWVEAVLGVCCTRCILYLVYGVLGVCCTWCMLYLVYTAFGVGCTQCTLYVVYTVLGVHCTCSMLYSVYAVLSVNSWSWHGEIERNNLTLCSGMMLELLTRRRVMGNEDENDVDKRIWHIRHTTCLFEVGRPRVSVSTRRIRTCTYHMGDGILTRTRNSLSPSFSCWCASSLLISLLLGPQFYRHLRTWS